MEILDPDLWNDDGTPKRPSKQYMQRLQEAQDAEAVDPDTPDKRAAEVAEAYISYARLRRLAKQERFATVGDIVHLWDHEQGCCRAALVVDTESLSDNCELHVFVPKKPAEFWYAAHDEDKGAETWHWPEEQ